MTSLLELDHQILVHRSDFPEVLVERHWKDKLGSDIIHHDWSWSHPRLHSAHAKFTCIKGICKVVQQITKLMKIIGGNCFHWLEGKFDCLLAIQIGDGWLYTSICFTFLFLQIQLLIWRRALNQKLKTFKTSINVCILITWIYFEKDHLRVLSNVYCSLFVNCFILIFYCCYLLCKKIQCVLSTA